MAVNQIAIDQLRLDEAFTGKMLHRAFNECWTVKCDELLLIVDDDKSQTSRFGDENDNRDKALAVINENRREIVLLSIDNQLLKAIEGGVADCALFDDKQFRFVEFKTNAEGKTPKSVRKTFDRATQQLKNTIRIFKDSMNTVDVQFEDAVAIRCHVVLSHSFPDSRSIMQAYRLEFGTDTNIPLSFDSATHWEKPEK